MQVLIKKIVNLTWKIEEYFHLGYYFTCHVYTFMQINFIGNKQVLRYIFFVIKLL